VLEIRNLVKVYPGPVTALQGVNLSIGQGMFGLLGPNGAGKTTLMRIVAGLLEPTSGSVTLDGEDIVDKPERVHGKLGYLPQDFGFHPHLTGEQMLLHLLRLKGVKAPAMSQRKLVRELLTRVGLDSAADRKVKTYSGGMRQRLGIAQAISGNPHLIVVDEPTAGLDLEERLRFYRVLAELAERRIVLLSTHIVEDVSVLCSRFAVIRGGRIVMDSTPAQARAQLAGRIFQGYAETADLRDLSTRHCMTEAVLVERRNRVRLFVASGPAPQGFSEAEPNIGDAYMVRMRESQEIGEPQALRTEAAAGTAR